MEDKKTQRRVDKRQQTRLITDSPSAYHSGRWTELKVLEEKQKQKVFARQTMFLPLVNYLLFQHQEGK